MPATELTTAQLRVLSHPTRLAFLRRLRTQGPATARELGREFEMDSGAASYHLRRLAQGGLIAEDVTLGTRRQRWWRPVARVSQFEPSAHRDDADLSREYVRSVVLSKADELQRLAETITTQPASWLESSMFFDRELLLDPTQLDELRTELLAVIESCRRRTDGTPGASAVRVAAHVQLYPCP